jgi:hypothetical protein
MMKTTLAFAALALGTGSALACSPAPSCWIEEGPAYLRSICRGYAKDGKSLREIATFVDEPKKIQKFAKACRKVGVTLKP